MMGWDKIHDAHNLVFLGRVFLQKLRSEADHHYVYIFEKFNQVRFHFIGVSQLYFHIWIFDQKVLNGLFVKSRDLINLSHWRLSNWTFFS